MLAEPESLAVLLLGKQGQGADAIRGAVTATLAEPTDDVPAMIPFDTTARKALELTFRQALRLGHTYIGTEHLLLALLEVENGTGPLSGLGVDRQRFEADLTETLAALTPDPS